MTPTFDILTFDDAAAIRAVAEWLADGSESQIRTFLSEPQNVAIVAKLDGVVIGLMYGYVLTTFNNPRPQFFVYSVDIREGYQGRGYGTLLMRHVMDWAKGYGCCESFLLTHRHNAAACKAYEAAGMVNYCKTDDVRMYEVGFPKTQSKCKNELSVISD